MSRIVQLVPRASRFACSASIVDQHPARASFSSCFAPMMHRFDARVQSAPRFRFGATCLRSLGA
jgi:hypothetical protein